MMRRLSALFAPLALLACSDGTDEPVTAQGTGEVLVPGEYLDVSALVLSDDSIYWLEGSTGSLQRASKGGRGRVVLAADLFDPRGLALHDGSLYFHSELEGQRMIQRVPVLGGDVEVLAVTPDLIYPGTLCVDGGDARFIESTPTDSGRPSGVVSLSLETLETTRLVEWPAGEHGFHLARDAGRTCLSREMLGDVEPYWTTDVIQCFASGEGDLTTVASDAWASSLVVDQGTLYFTDPTDIAPEHGAYRLSLHEGAELELLFDAPWLDGAAVRDGQLFVQDVDRQWLLAIDPQSGEIRELSRNAAGGRFDGNLAVDATHVYFATERGIERAPWRDP